MAKLILIRHAQTHMDPDSDAKMWRLAKGAKEATQALATRLKTQEITRIVTSDESKAVQTGRILAEVLACPCRSWPNLHEQDRTGAPFLQQAVFIDYARAGFTQSDRLIWGTETFDEALERFESALLHVIRTYPSDTLAVVTHGTVMSLLIAKFNYQVDAFTLWRSFLMPDVRVLSLPFFQLLPE